jgi:hypothetical protein
MSPNQTPNTDYARLDAIHSSNALLAALRRYAERYQPDAKWLQR